MLKVGREEIVGLTSAIEQYVNLDHQKRDQWAEDVVVRLQQAFTDIPHVTVTRSYPNEAGQPMARAIVTHASMSSQTMMRLLMEGDPGIYTMHNDERSIFINPMTLSEDEVATVIARLQQMFSTFTRGES